MFFVKYEIVCYSQESSMNSSMKTVHSHLIIFVILLALSALDSSGQSFGSSDVFAVKPTDYRYLWYGEYFNSFDSARVVCTFGEAEIQSGSTNTRIALRLSESQFKSDASPGCVTSDTNRGRVTSLENFIRTEQFLVPSGGGTFNFLRMVTAEDMSGCGGDKPTDNSGHPNNWRDAMLSIPKGGWIPDTTSFVVEVVNVTDATVATLDSLKVWGQSGFMKLRSAGSSLNRVEHSVSIPTACNGDSVYLRFVAYRRGPTPAGVTGRMTRSIYSLSTAYRDTTVPFTSTPRWASPSFADSVYREYAKQILSYWSEDTSRICLPIVFGFQGLPPAIDSAFIDSLTTMGRSMGAEYCQCISSWNSDSSSMYSTLFPPATMPKARIDGSSSSNQMLTRASMYVTESGSSLTISLKGSSTIATLDLYDIKGSLLRNLWEGIVPATLSLDTSDFPVGAAILILKAPQQGRVQAYKLLIK